MSAPRAAAASEGPVAQAARDALARGGNAVDAVVTAVLVAAGDAPGVLLGPVQLLVGGAGAGLVAIDGRVRQPGLGAQRPRGVVAGEAVPPAARVGVPALPAALAAALASFGRATLTRAAGPALEAVRTRAPERHAVLRALARRGPRALLDDAIGGELLAVAGRAAGGALTREDLASVVPEVVSSAESSLRPGGILRAPWGGEGREAAATTEVVAAADGRGLVAVACYEVAADGVAVAPLGLVAPAVASPVLRGQTRVRPGEPCPAAAPVALRARKGVVDLALGIARAADAEAALDAVVRALADAPTVSLALAAAPAQAVPVAVVWSREAARAVTRES